MSSWTVQAKARRISAKNRRTKEFRCSPRRTNNMHFPRQDYRFYLSDQCYADPFEAPGLCELAGPLPRPLANPPIAI